LSTRPPILERQNLSSGHYLFVFFDTTIKGVESHLIDCPRISLLEVDHDGALPLSGQSGRAVASQESPLLAEAVEKLGRLWASRNNRIKNAAPVNHSCSNEPVPKSILRANGHEIVFQQPQPITDIGLEQIGAD
jgi:hypothetical protein